jgi:hypothetical protein
MTNEIMPREDRMGKILTFLGGCFTGVLGVFAVAVMSNLESSEEKPSLASEDEFDEQGARCKVVYRDNVTD